MDIVYVLIIFVSIISIISANHHPTTIPTYEPTKKLFTSQPTPSEFTLQPTPSAFTLQPTPTLITLQPTPTDFDPLTISKPPTDYPTTSPTNSPTNSPTKKPSHEPTNTPTYAPTPNKPTESPTLQPTGNANFTIGDIFILVGVVSAIIIGIVLYLSFGNTPVPSADGESTPLVSNPDSSP